MIYNVIGQGIPLVVAFYAIPLIIQGYGVERFGILSIAWMAIGYFSVFDLGLGRALTQMVSDKLGQGLERDIPKIFWTSMGMMSILGIVGALCSLMLAHWLVYDVLQISASLQKEALIVFYLLSISVPIVIIMAGARGFLEAYQRIDLVNYGRVPAGILSFFAPLVLLLFSSSLIPAILALLAIKSITALFYLISGFYVEPELRSRVVLSLSITRPLMYSGGWMTVTNIVGPIMTYFDRFLVGAIISMTFVTYYVTPYEVVTKLWLISGTIVGVLFPAFAISYSRDRQRTVTLFNNGLKYVFLVLFPITFVIVMYASEGLSFWLGGDFSAHSTKVLQCLAVGVFVHALAQIPFVLLQGAGRSDLAGKLHLVELPFYLATILFLAKSYGINGVAFAWTLRVVVDALLLSALSFHVLPIDRKTVWRMVLFMAVACVFFLIAGFLGGGLLRNILGVVSIPLFVTISWCKILSSHERVFVSNGLMCFLRVRNAHS